MENKERPIGFFDSGVGGLSVLKHAMRELPQENFIFYGDNGHVPYGEKSPREIRRLTIQACDQLFYKGVKTILVACNTATSAAILAMREKYRFPVISMEPAIKPACASELTGKIVVLATPGTLASARYKRLVQRVGCGKRLLDIPCGGLADMLESGDFENPALDAYLEEKLRPLAGEVVRGIVIGCTHYSFIAEKIRAAAAKAFRGDCTLYDGMYGTVRHLKQTLTDMDMLSPGPGGALQCYSSGGETSLAIIHKILNG